MKDLSCSGKTSVQFRFKDELDALVDLYGKEEMLKRLKESEPKTTDKKIGITVMFCTMSEEKK